MQSSGYTHQPLQQYSPELPEFFCQLQLDRLEELGNCVSFPDHHFAPVTCPIPIAVRDGQRFILHYLSASKTQCEGQAAILMPTTGDACIK